MFLFTRLTASDSSCLSFLSISSDINTFALGKLFSICLAKSTMLSETLEGSLDLRSFVPTWRITLVGVVTLLSTEIE